MDTRAAIVHYCQYQERCHQEVRNKLYDLGCYQAQVEEIISELIQQDLLNEERYARAIVRGKFRLKKWGRNKIIYKLKQNKVSAYCIKKALTEIDEAEYEVVLFSLVHEKWKELKSEKNPFTKRAKTLRFLLQKGFESNLTQEKINELINKQKK